MNEIILAGALIIDNNKLLLIHRNKVGRTQWELPGGKLELGETLEETVIRELKEELNIDVGIEKYLTCENSIEDNNILKYHWYKCYIKNGIPTLMEDKFDEIRYFKKEELDNIELSSNMKVLKKKIDINEL